MIFNAMGQAGAAPGCLLRGGGGAKCLATAARAQTFCASPEKVAQRGEGGGGGGSDTFLFFDFNFFPKHFHNGVGGIIMAMTDR